MNLRHLTMRDLSKKDWAISGTITLIVIVGCAIGYYYDAITLWETILICTITDVVTDATIIKIRTKGQKNVQ